MTWYRLQIYRRDVVPAMDLTDFFLVFILHFLSLCYVNARYNKDVVCIFDKGVNPICRVVPPVARRDNLVSTNLPSFDPYIPRKYDIFYNCTSLTCDQLFLNSLAQITDPGLVLRGCFKSIDKYICERLRYYHLKNVDKLLFLNSHVKDNKYYTVDCLVYEDGSRICHKKQNANSHTDLVDTGTIVSPNKSNILSQDEFLCEESLDGNVNCYTIPFVSFDEKLAQKEFLSTKGDILLKTDDYVAKLKKNCLEKMGSFCSYSGVILKSARRQGFLIPTGLGFSCSTTRRQLVCKRSPL